jgi:ParB family chromosome partitioning protein
VLQPILVRDHGERPGEYEIVAGERRWRAAQRAQLHQVPVVVRQIDDGQALELALVENLQREDLTALEEADAYHHLMESFDYTQEALAKDLGKSRSHIANCAPCRAQ